MTSGIKGVNIMFQSGNKLITASKQYEYLCHDNHMTYSLIDCYI